MCGVPIKLHWTRQSTAYSAMTSAQEIRDRLEGYARAKIASVMQPLTEKLLIDQPGDPIEYMVRYLVQNRNDLRKHVVSETLAVREEGGRRSIPVVDHPLYDCLIRVGFVQCLRIDLSRIR